MVRKLIVTAALAMAAWPGAASATWQQASSAHFIVYADDKPAKVQAFTERLEKFDKTLRVIRGLKEAPTTDADRVRVYMNGDVAFIGKLAGKGLSNAAGFYESRVGGPVAFVPRDAPSGSPYDLNAQAILFHEYSHHFMFMTFPSAVFPSWLVEGFAEFNATAIFEKDGSVTIGQAPGYRAWSMTNSDQLPASRLVQLDPGKLTDDQTDVLYARGWLLTHLLMFDPARAGQLGQYIAAINSGKSDKDAANVFGDLKKLDRDMTTYAERPMIKVWKITADKLDVPPVTVRPMTAGEAAVMPALIQSTRGVDDAQATVVAALARKLAAPYPNDAGAQNELAEAEFDAGNLDASDAAATRALAADPKSMHALIYRGRIQEARLIKAGDSNPDHWRDARHWYIRANAIDPDNPLPLTLFFRSFGNARIAPTKNAEDGLIAAYMEAPFALDLRMTAAAIYLRRGDERDARFALLPVAYSPHRAAFSAVALRALTAIDDGKTKDALAIMERGGSGAKQEESAPAGGAS